MNKFKVLIMCFLFSLAGHSFAAVWSITSVENGTDSVFGFSGFHTPNPGNVMSGSSLGGILSGTGTYNDVTGAVNYTLQYENNNGDTDTFNLLGTLLFSGQELAANSTLAYSSLDNIAGVSSNGEIGYLPGYVCCNSADYRPNGLEATGTGTYFMTLWGADGFDINGSGQSAYSNSTLGMDLRVELSQVPVPAALWLMSSGLAFLMTVSKRKRSAI